LGRQAGVNSLEIGLRLARVLARTGVPEALKDLATRAGMPPAKAHRYLVSLIRAGLAEQDLESGRYRLGPLALELGLGALRGLDVLRFGGEAVAELRAATDETVMLCIWGNRGPVVVRWEESSRPVATNVRAGWVMPLVNSATGRLFAAYLPQATTAQLLEEEFGRIPHARAGYSALLEDIRSRGLSRVEGELLRGVGGIAAPVFGIAGTIVAALTLVGIQGTIDVRWNGAVARALKQAADRLSRRLGFTGEAASQSRRGGHAHAIEPRSGARRSMRV
jgi:DNA-binding IclR family transcriptional regulator